MSCQECKMLKFIIGWIMFTIAVLAVTQPPATHTLTRDDGSQIIITGGHTVRYVPPPSPEPSCASGLDCLIREHWTQIPAPNDGQGIVGMRHVDLRTDAPVQE